jgi:hypothetical protein
MSQTLNKILEAYPENDFVIVNGFNDAVVGVDLDSGRLIYSVSKCIDVLVYEDGMVFEDAAQFFDRNIMRVYEQMENGPIWANTEF